MADNTPNEVQNPHTPGVAPDPSVPNPALGNTNANGTPVPEENEARKDDEVAAANPLPNQVNPNGPAPAAGSDGYMSTQNTPTGPSSDNK